MREKEEKEENKLRINIRKISTRTHISMEIYKNYIFIKRIIFIRNKIIIEKERYILHKSLEKIFF